MTAASRPMAGRRDGRGRCPSHAGGRTTTSARSIRTERTTAAAGISAGSRTGLLLEGEDALPVVLHADDRPAPLLRLVVQSLGEGADLRVGQPQGRPVGVLAR